MTVAITQPTFLPWLGYFNLVATADVFVVLDTVQFEKQSWQTRNRVRTRKGEVLWLPVPVVDMPLSTLIKDIRIAPNPPTWRRKLFATLDQNLARAPFYKEARELARIVLEPDTPHELLAEMNIDFIRGVARAFGLKAQILRSSELPGEGVRADLLLGLCRHFGADRYYSNAGSSVYLEESRPMFAEAGVEIVYQQWSHPEYQQAGEGFVSHLCCLDAIACMGVEQAGASVRP